jgi:hypothetical protein
VWIHRRLSKYFIMDSMLLDDDDAPMLVDTDGTSENLENIESNLDDTLRLLKVPITIVTGMESFKAFSADCMCDGRLTGN